VLIAEETAGKLILGHRSSSLSPSHGELPVE